MQKKNYNNTANQQLLPFRKIDCSMTDRIIFLIILHQPGKS